MNGGPDIGCGLEKYDQITKWGGGGQLGATWE